jgi:hypothetical protein
VEGDPLSLPFLPVIPEGGLLPLLLSLLLPVILERSEDPRICIWFRWFDQAEGGSIFVGGGAGDV